MPSYRNSDDRFSATTNLLLVEKALETSGQEWIENVNIIEQLLVRVVSNMAISNGENWMKATFIVRRLPTFLAPFINGNEYGIVLTYFPFSTTPQSRPGTSSMERPAAASVNYGQTEIFPVRNSIPDITDDELLDGNNGAFLAHEFFKRFTSAFIDSYHAECELLTNGNEKEEINYSGRVQLVGPHLLLGLQSKEETPEIGKIFTLIQPPLPLPQNLKEKCKVNVNYLKSMLSIVYGDTEVVVRPCLFQGNGFSKVNSNVLERLPLHHPNYLAIGEGLRLGYFLFPTSFETLWTVGLWPSESHILSVYHPSSVLCRVLKLFATFCLNPSHFWDTINATFVPLEDISCQIQNLLEDSGKSSMFSFDFVLSSFLTDMEGFSSTEDWAPRNFWTRLMNLLRSAVDSFDKGFHPHYFTKVNVLRGIWKDFEREEKSALRELDDVTESQENLDDYGDLKASSIIAMNDLDDDFGFQFADLETVDDFEHFEVGEIPSRPNSAMIYKNVITKERPTSLSKTWGSALINKLSVSKKNREKSLQSIDDIAEGFEQSVAQMRMKPLHLRFHKESDTYRETGFSLTSTTTKTVTTLAYQNANAGFQQGPSESVYSLLLQSIQTLPSTLSQETVLCQKALESQEALITLWSRTCSDFPRPPNPSSPICPHVFSKRQIRYIAMIIETVGKIIPNLIKRYSASWEISGDVLRTVLHQMRVEVAESDTLREKQKPKWDRENEKKEKTKKSGAKRSLSLKKFSFRKRNKYECEHSSAAEKGGIDAQNAMAMDDAETAATHRLLEWLWNLRCSEIGRLSGKAEQYMANLYETSLVNSYFLEQMDDDKQFLGMALKSAVAVTRIMRNLMHPVALPLSIATEKGWLYAEMILSLASWNGEKGYQMKASVPTIDEENETLERVLLTEETPGIFAATSTLKKKLLWHEAEGADPDLEAATLAFHSELATPIGWNDFEDPRRPGPLAVPILIFSSGQYFKKWEVGICGNLVQVLLRMQLFNSLQSIAQMLSPPHRKTALNEIRKLNKSLSIRITSFDDNVMSKTFRRLNSVRATRSRMLRREMAGRNGITRRYSCRELGCLEHRGNDETITTNIHGREVECTKL